MPDATTLYTSSFDLTFDQTFQNLIPQTGSVAADPCRLPGVYLYWLSRFGWCGYLFRGKADSDKEPRAVGAFQSGGLSRNSLRITTPSRTVRAGNLTETDAYIVSSVVESIAVFALAPNRAGKILAVPVYVEPATVPIWREGNNRIGVEIKYSLPATKSQRA